MSERLKGQVLVIYHGGGCLDGFGSAFAAWQYFDGQSGLMVEYYAAKHGDPPPDVCDKTVYMLDFAYPRSVMVELCSVAEKIVVLDHHISAAEDLKGLETECHNLELVFDMERSGAIIAWEFFHNEPAPGLLAIIQDRDLWHFKIPQTKHVTAALMSYPFEFELWETFSADVHLEQLVHEGAVINRYRQQMIEQYRKKVVWGQVAGHRVPVVNCPAAITSELLSDLAKGQDFAAGYTDSDGKRGWSLRSDSDGKNVAEIAALFGGGGHPRAAGFSTALDAVVLDPMDP